MLNQINTYIIIKKYYLIHYYLKYVALINSKLFEKT